MTIANLTFDVNMTASEVMIPLVNDDTAELEEYFSVNLTEITPNVVVDTYSVDVTIIDDDGKFINPKYYTYYVRTNIHMKAVVQIQKPGTQVVRCNCNTKYVRMYKFTQNVQVFTVLYSNTFYFVYNSFSRGICDD